MYTNSQYFIINMTNRIFFAGKTILDQHRSIILECKSTI